MWANVAWVVLPLVVVVILIVPFVISRVTEKTQTFTVRSEGNITTSSNSNGTTEIHHKYLIYTDHGTYEDTDSVLFFKFNSSDLYGDLQVGHKYSCLTTGYRLPFASSYRNLIKCHEVQ